MKRMIEDQRCEQARPADVGRPRERRSVDDHDADSGDRNHGDPLTTAAARTASVPAMSAGRKSDGVSLLGTTLTC